jgi:hypothetical protein
MPICLQSRISNGRSNLDHDVEVDASVNEGSIRHGQDQTHQSKSEIASK